MSFFVFSPLCELVTYTPGLFWYAETHSRGCQVTASVLGGLSMQSRRFAQVDSGRCVACGSCIRVCPMSAISVVRGCHAVVDPQRCVGCGKCAMICPPDCITLVMREGHA